MHFLTPHVEISMAENDTFKVNWILKKNIFESNWKFGKKIIF